MTNKKLSWKEIKQLYHNQWVELIDYEWEETETDPKAGVVRIHSKNRKEFEELICKNPPIDSALIFVGNITLPPGMTLSSNQNQFLK